MCTLLTSKCRYKHLNAAFKERLSSLQLVDPLTGVTNTQEGLRRSQQLGYSFTYVSMLIKPPSTN